MATSLHYFKPGQDVTCVPTAALTGATIVKVVAGGSYNQPYIGQAENGDTAFGVLARDCEKDEPVLVHTGGIVPITAGAAIAAGDVIGVGADGKAVKAGSGATTIGQAVADAGNGEPASVLLSI